MANIENRAPILFKNNRAICSVAPASASTFPSNIPKATMIPMLPMVDPNPSESNLVTLVMGSPAANPVNIPTDKSTRNGLIFNLMIPNNKMPMARTNKISGEVGI